MCVRLEIGGVHYVPGDVVPVHIAGELLRVVWSGYVPLSKVDQWKGYGAKEVEVEASAYATRARGARDVTWTPVAGGSNLRGIVEFRQEDPLLRLVVKDAAVANKGKVGATEQEPAIAPKHSLRGAKR
jgi:hypothetical protein